MKKFGILLFSAAVLFSQISCGTTRLVTRKAETTETVSAETEEETKAETEEETRETSAKKNVSAMAYSFEGFTAVDNDQCSIQIDSVEDDEIWGFVINVTLENKSSDKTYMFSVDGATVNGVQDDPYFSAEVAAGKKAKESISFSDLENYGITECTDVMLTFQVYDSDNWESSVVEGETVHVYPFGEENAAAFTRESASTDQILVDNDSVTVVLIGTEEDELWGYTVNFYIINKTDANLMCAIDNASVNDYMADPYFATSILPGAQKFTGASWSGETLQESGVETVEYLDFTLRIYNWDDLEADDLFNESIHVTP